MIIAFLLILILLYAVAKLFLSGPDLSIYDQPAYRRFPAHPDDVDAERKTVALLRGVRKDVQALRSIKGSMMAVRKFADELSADLETDSEFRSVDANGVPCEWTLRENTSPKNRVLFLHGGAFLFGSSKGHRKFTDQLAKLTNAAVLSVDYRMLPENSRKASVKDTQVAYRWLLENGPNGPQEIDKLMICGDSAGGNLALMAANWGQQNTEKKADAVVAICPSTDMTLSSPTILGHRKTDKMLGQSIGFMGLIPAPIRLWIGACLMRVNPSDPLVSPLFQDLSNLPPTLIHASSNEILLAEANRYTNKARVSGSNVIMQVWQNQIHDWHLFNLGSGSAGAAWEQIRLFLKEHFVINEN